MNCVFNGLLIERSFDVSSGHDDRDDPQEAAEQDVEGHQETKETANWSENKEKNYVKTCFKIAQRLFQIKLSWLFLWMFDVLWKKQLRIAMQSKN